VLALANEVMQTHRHSDALLEHMRHLFSHSENVELLLVVGWYSTAGRLMTTLDIKPDPALCNKQALESLHTYQEHKLNACFQLFRCWMIIA
jgi:hypothetical protein